MSDKSHTEDYSEDKKYILSELNHVNNHLNKIDDSFTVLRQDIKDSNRLLVATLQEQVQIPTQAIINHEETCREDKTNLWKNIYSLQKNIAIHKAKVGVWAGIGSFFIATIVSIGFIVIKSWVN